MVGLGEHALAKGYKRTFLISEDYGFPYSQVQGFMAELLRQGRQGHRQGLGAARHQGLRLGDRQDPEGRRRAGRRARRLRRGELPDPVRAGGRQQADDRRLDHGRPDGAQLQGQAPRIAARHGRRPGRWPTRSTRPSGRSSSPTTRRNFKDGFPSPSLFAYLYYINTKATLDGARRRQGRSVGRPEGVPRRAAEDQASRARPATSRSTTTATAIGTTYITEVAKAAGRLVLQQGRQDGAEHHADARPAARPSSRRWASARATCPTAASKERRADGVDHLASPAQPRGGARAHPAACRAVGRCCRATRCVLDGVTRVVRRAARRRRRLALGGGGREGARSSAPTAPARRRSSTPSPATFRPPPGGSISSAKTSWSCRRTSGSARVSGGRTSLRFSFAT